LNVAHRIFAPAIVLAVGLASSTEARAEDPVVQGARSFQAGRFAEALVEFEVAERQEGAGEATWYAAAALERLGRPEDALETFYRAEATAPEARDALLDYYFALALYEARLYLAADAMLERITEHAGKKVAAQAARVRADLRALLQKEPPASAIDGYLLMAGDAEKRSRWRIAEAYYREAVELGRKLSTPHRVEEATAGEKRAHEAGKR
jgi:tetratricopeptide (TPR) repeat protein